MKWLLADCLSMGDDPTSVMSQHLNATPTFPTLINPTIPTALAVVIMRCLAKDPATRFPSASTLTAAIAEALNVPVPESVGNPAYPVDAEYMPTYITPARGNLPPGMTPSSPGLPVATPPVSTGQSGTPFALSSSGGQSTPPVATGNSNPGFTPAMYSSGSGTPMPSSQPYPMATPGGQSAPTFAYNLLLAAAPSLRRRRPRLRHYQRPVRHHHRDGSDAGCSSGCLLSPSSCWWALWEPTFCTFVLPLAAVRLRQMPSWDMPPTSAADK